MKDRISPSVHQILHAPTDSEYLELLITTIRDACFTGRDAALADEFSRFSDAREAEIERLCNNNHQDFVSSVDQLLKVRTGTVDLTHQILKLNEAIQTSTRKVVEHKKALVDSRDVRQNIDEATQALRLCLEVLGLANRVEGLLKQKKHYSALRTLDELRTVHLKEVVQFDVADMIQDSVPQMQGMVKEAVMTDLNAWLYKIRESSQLLGQVAFDQTELRRQRQKARVKKSPYLKSFKLNSAIELVLDEREEFDVLSNDHVKIDFTPLFECLHIHEALGERDDFRVIYANVRRQQKELLMPSSLGLSNDDISALNHLLEGICGFAILERATMRKTGSFRSQADVDELWDSMSKKAIGVITPSLDAITVADTLPKIKNVLALFIQTIDTWGYSVDVWDSFLLVLFKKYSSLLQSEFSADFREIVANDDYMPMVVKSREEYDNLLNVSWFPPDRPADQMTFPSPVKFSQMYALSCIDIRDLLNKYILFSDECFDHHQSAIDDELQQALDKLLCNTVCASLVNRLSSTYLGQIVQIFSNLQHFVYACEALELLLAQARNSPPPSPISLRATDLFTSHKKTAEKRIFELVNSKIDDLVSTADYDWVSPQPRENVAEYLQQLTMYLGNIMSAALHPLPEDIRGMIYFSSLEHVATAILNLPLAEDVRVISQAAVSDLKTDVEYLREYVMGMGEPMLIQVFEELGQTIGLLQAGREERDEFYMVEVRMRKYPAVDPLRAPVLMEKVLAGEGIGGVDKGEEKGEKGGLRAAVKGRFRT